MGGPLGSYPVALLSYAPTGWRLVAVCALALVLIPTSLAQNPQQITPTFTPSDGWHNMGALMVSTGGSDNYSAKFTVDSNAWSKVIISAAVTTGHGDGEAALLEDGQQVLTFGYQQGGVTHDIPAGNHIYTYTIKANPSSPDSIIYVYQVLVSGVRSSATQTPATSLPETQAPSVPLEILSTAITAIATSSTSSSRESSVVSTLSFLLANGSVYGTQPMSLTTIPVVTTASPTIPTEPLSPPAFTSSPASISEASIVSSGSGTPGPNSGVIVGAVFGILAGIALCIFAGLLYRRRRVRSRVAPSTAFMNYRSTTEQPPAYPFNRTSFFQRSKAGLAGFGGFGDSKATSPHSFFLGVAAGAGGRRLTLDKKSAEGRDSPMTASTIAPSYEDPHRPIVSYQGQGGMGVGGDIDGGSLGVAGAGAYGPATSRGLSIDCAKTLTPFSSTTSDKFASTPSFLDENPYDGLTMPKPVVNSHADPFRTPPEDDNMAGREAWGRA